MKVVRLDVSDIGEFKNIFEVLRSVFGEETIVLYGIINSENKLDVLCRSGYKVLYFQNNDVISISNYEIDDNYQIDRFAYNDVEYSLTDQAVYTIRNGVIEESLTLMNDLDDDNPYAGHVIYTQYNYSTDVEASIKYYHSVSLKKEGKRNRIYSFNVRDIDLLSIDEKARRKPFEWGFAGKKHKYFGKMSIDCESYDYDLLAIKEHGLLAYLHDGSYSLLKNREVIRYSKGLFLSRNGDFRCTWPFGYAYSQEQLKELLKSYSFQSEIPSDLLDVYNGEHEMYKKVSAVLQQVKELELDKERREKVAMLMKLHS